MISKINLILRRAYYKNSIRFYFLLLETLPSRWARDRLNKVINKASPKRFLKGIAQPIKGDSDIVNHHMNASLMFGKTAYAHVFRTTTAAQKLLVGFRILRQWEAQASP